MKFVAADWDPEVPGFRLDAHAYLAELPRLSADLPPSALSFATDPGQYDIAGAIRCVKDLELAGVHLATDKSGGLVLEFAPDKFKHDSGLAFDGRLAAGQLWPHQPQLHRSLHRPGDRG
ncbi:hypothetical protein [Streptomyces sp. NBC_00343]|uniref:hypothetical protein n=1 Tax=Streptomyces sp. NBC_00343 TaxID=2975719 RepID=UPI002E2C5DD4|nr:hypothetical protein [Streptomyces sp. NBC_00343]